MTEPKLSVELVPRTCFFSNVRSAVSRAVWTRLRSEVIEKAGYKCEVCGTDPKSLPLPTSLECHEVWSYEAGVQRLERLTALCPDCHSVKHLGLAFALKKATRAMRHLRKVNDWSDLFAMRYIAQVFELWESRSATTWSLDLSHLASYGLMISEDHLRKIRP